MSDQLPPEHRPWAPPGSSFAPPPPPAPSYVTPERPRRKGRAALGVAAAVIVLAGAGITWKVVSDKSAAGPSTPEAATQAFVDAMQNGDVLGMVDALAPTERTIVRDEIDQWVKEGQRLGLLRANLDLKKVPGYSLQITGLGMTSETVNDHIALTHVNKGTYRASAVMRSLPLGDVVTQHMPTDVTNPSATGDLAHTPIDLAAVKEGGAWHVSVLYTAAELIRRRAGAAAPTAADRVEAKGADSPEAALRELVSAGVGTDLRRAIELMPPDEMAVMHDYAGLLVREADKAKAEVEGKVLGQGTVTVDDLAFEQANVTGGIKLLPTKIALTVTDKGEKRSVVLRKVGQDCVTYAVSATADAAAENGQACGSDLNVGRLPLPSRVQDLVSKLVGQLGSVGIVTTKVDGKWYVSPVRTYTDVFFTLSGVVDKIDINALFTS